MSDPNSSNRTVKSDEKLFDIIEFIQSQEEAGVTEIASHLGFPKSTVHKHLVTLQQRGYLVNEDGRYRIGLKFLDHGKHAQIAQDIYEIGRKKVEEIAEETGELVWCVVEENGLAYYLYGATGKHPVHPPVRIGQSVYTHQIAAGKAILAHLPEPQVTAIVDRHGLPPKTENTITDREALAAELEQIRESGIAFNREESLPGLTAIGAPIKSNERVYGALSISGPSNRIDEDSYLEPTKELLLGATNELEINISYA